MSWEEYLPNDLKELYEIHDYKHAAAILAKEFPTEFAEICDALRQFRFTEEDLLKPGGNESGIPKIFTSILRPLGWNEKNLEAELMVYEIASKKKEFKNKIRHGSHKVDYLKGRIAFDLEWNSKDQTFDRDIFAFRSFFEYDAISVGILVTRSLTLNPILKDLGIKRKYGASTTHLGKLLNRLEAGRSGGCPVLVFGITPALMAKK
jgi:CRISPR-associated protein Csd2